LPARKSDRRHHRPDLSTVIGASGAGEYLGATVQVIPHVPDAIKEFIHRRPRREDSCGARSAVRSATSKACRFLEAIRQLGNELGRERVCSSI